MAVTLQSIQTFIDDLRVDNTPGTVDVQGEGLRAINFILQDMQSRHDWEFTQQDLCFRYYNGCWRYALPSSFKSMRSVYRTTNYFDYYRMVEPTVFNKLTRNGGYWEPLISTERTPTGRLWVYSPQTNSWTISLSGNAGYDTDGTWVASNNAKNVHTDNRMYHENDGCISFDCDESLGASAATITVPNKSVSDIEDFRDGKIFCWVYISNNAHVTSFTLRWGQDASNYYENTQTAQCDGVYFENGWNLLGFDFEGAASSGSPDAKLVSYIQFSLTHSAGIGLLRNIRVGEMKISTYEDMILKYYTYDTVKDVSANYNVRKFDGTSTLDEFLFPDEMESIVENGAAWILLRQMGEPDEAERCRTVYEQLMTRFMEKYPSKTKQPEPPALYIDWYGKFY